MKKLNNKILIIVLLVLAGVFGLSRIFRASSGEGNLRKQLVNLDTAAISEIKIYPNAEHNREVRLVREGKLWTVKMGDRSFPAEQGGALGAASQFAHLRPLRLAAKKKTKWKEFNVGDTSTQVKFMKGAEVLADLRVGKIGFNQQPGRQQFNPGDVFTYIRLSDEDEVYSVEGFLGTVFDRSVNDWRDKSFLRVKPNTVSKMTFTYPADSGFVIERRDKKWWVNNTDADSVKVKNFLAQAEFKNATIFADDFKPGGSAQVVIQFNGVAGTLSTVRAWKRPDDWVTNSSHQSSVYFSSKGLESLLEGKKNFLPEKKKQAN